MLLSFLQGLRVLAPPTVLLRRSMNLVRGCLEPLLHGRGGIGDPYGELVLPFPSHPASRARICLARCAQCAAWKRTHSGSVRSPSLGCFTNRSPPPAGNS